MEKRKIAKRGELTFEQYQRTTEFFGLAYDDYVAARQLLMKNLLVQGCVLANTAIEKYFKGIKALLGEPIPHHHDITVKKFIGTISNQFPATFRLFNIEFLYFLSKSYQLRYLDEIKEGFSIVFIKRKTLAELDYMIAKIEETFDIRLNDQREKSNKYSSSKRRKDPLLWEMNYYLNELNKADFLKHPDFVIETRKEKHGNIISLGYRTDQIEDDGVFLYEGLRVVESQGNEIKVQFCFHPVKERIE